MGGQQFIYQETKFETFKYNIECLYFDSVIHEPLVKTPSHNTSTMLQHSLFDEASSKTSPSRIQILKGPTLSIQQQRHPPHSPS